MSLIKNKYAVIDIGSNSVRLMFSNRVSTIEKLVKTTRLAEGMTDGKLNKDSILRTATAIKEFVELARAREVMEIFVFATAAVRQAENKGEFLHLVKDLTGIDVDVISGEQEAFFGLKGALLGKDGAIIDVGGASSEVIVCKDSQIVYSKSVNIGAVKITDACGQDREKVEALLKEIIDNYGIIPKAEFYGIGGTATSIAAMLLELEQYSPQKVNGYRVDIGDLTALTDKLFTMSVDERKQLKGLQPERAKVIAGGCAIVLSILKKVGATQMIVSESDNLEGYLMNKLEKI